MITVLMIIGAVFIAVKYISTMSESLKKELYFLALFFSVAILLIKFGTLIAKIAWVALKALGRAAWAVSKFISRLTWEMVKFFSRFTWATAKLVTWFAWDVTKLSCKLIFDTGKAFYQASKQPLDNSVNSQDVTKEGIEKTSQVLEQVSEKSDSSEVVKAKERDVVKRAQGSIQVIEQSGKVTEYVTTEEYDYDEKGQEILRYEFGYIDENNRLRYCSDDGTDEEITDEEMIDIPEGEEGEELYVEVGEDFDEEPEEEMNEEEFEENNKVLALERREERLGLRKKIA